jgi:hypothetical protein
LQNDEDVKVAVSKNFEEIVLDESKDTLLEVRPVLMDMLFLE